jgi:anti-sigma regulatory factor (Ser/Thr protein kinase)
MHHDIQVTSVQAPGRPSNSGELQPPTPAPPAAAGDRRITLAPAPESTKTARDFTTATLRGWHLDALTLDTLTQDAVIVASELVTNAIRHATPFPVDNAEHSWIELTWQRQASCLICVVTDRSPRPPVLAPADPDAQSGRGLQVVQALAVTWGWTTLGTQGKAVWAALRLPGTR